MSMDDALKNSTIRNIHFELDNRHDLMQNKWNLKAVVTEYQRMVSILKTFTCSALIGSLPL